MLRSLLFLGRRLRTTPKESPNHWISEYMSVFVFNNTGRSLDKGHSAYAHITLASNLSISPKPLVIVVFFRQKIR